MEKEAGKENFFKKLWGSFSSLDKFTKLFLVSMALFLVAVPTITKEYLDTRQRAAGPITSPTPSPTFVFGKSVLFNNVLTQNIQKLTILRNQNNTLKLNSDFTIEFWIKFNDFPNSDQPLLKIGNNLEVITRKDVYGFNYQVITTKNSSKFDVFSVNPALEKNEWYHMAYTYLKNYYGGSYIIYANGESRFSSSEPYEDDLANIEIGQILDGEIDEIRISNISRYPYTSGPSTYTKPSLPFTVDLNTMALLHLDDNTKDTSGNNNDGIFSGAPIFVNSTVGPAFIPITPPPTNISPTLTPTPPPTNISLNLYLDGIGFKNLTYDNKNPVNKKRNLTLQVFDLNNNLILEKTGEVDYSDTGGTFKGIVDLGYTLKTGTYNVKIRMEKYLKKLIKNVQMNANTNNITSETTLLPGDINIVKDQSGNTVVGDNKVNLADYQTFYSCLSSTTTACINKADLNSDNIVNLSDYSLLMKNYGKVGN